jgi:hypothetical protein
VYGDRRKDRVRLATGPVPGALLVVCRCLQGVCTLAGEDGRACRSAKRTGSRLSSHLRRCGAMSSLEVLSAAGLRCKLRSHDQGARVTTTKRRKSTLVSLSRSCQPGLERTRGLPRHSLHAFVASHSCGMYTRTGGIELELQGVRDRTLKI